MINVRVTMQPNREYSVSPQEFTDLSRMGLVLEVLSDKSLTEIKDADDGSADEQEGVA